MLFLNTHLMNLCHDFEAKQIQKYPDSNINSDNRK